VFAYETCIAKYGEQNSMHFLISKVTFIKKYASFCGDYMLALKDTTDIAVKSHVICARGRGKWCVSRQALIIITI
jgi:hypothetical protein